MLERIEDSTFTMGTHIAFRNLGNYWGGKERKTNIYDVLTNYNEKLGEIRWFGRWRKYCFFPGKDTVYEETCMREISQFIEEETKAQRSKAKAAKA